MKTKSPLPYFGSDAQVARELGALLDDCNHVTIPFVGGASILPHLKSRAIVANDLHALAINFYRQMSSTNKELLIARCQCTLSHPGNLELAQKTMQCEAPRDVDRAWAFWALCWLGRKGKGGTKYQGGKPSVRRTANGGNNASRVRAAAGDLEAWAEHFERCEWEQSCFRELLPKVADDTQCGIYADPPWVGARDYLHSFNEKDHRDLAEQLNRFEQTKIVVRYGDDSLIRELYSGWTFIEQESRTQANTKINEIWITKN